MIFGIGLKFLLTLVQVGIVILFLATLVMLVVKLVKIAIVWIAPMVGADADEILATIRGWMPKRPKWLTRKRKYTRRVK